MIVESFVGPSNVMPGTYQDAEDTINFFIASTQPGSGKAPKALYGTPCVEPFAQGPDGGIRYNGEFQQDGRAFAIAGQYLIEVFEDGTVINRGSVGDDGAAVSIVSNGTAGNQILIISAGLGFIFNTQMDTLAQITDPDFPADVIQCEFMDGYFIVLIRNSRRFQISALEDGTSWDALDVGEISEASDNLQSMKRNHREIWFLGTQTGEIWYDNGDPLFPFAPIQGVFLETGSAAPFAICRADNTIFWLGQDERGRGVVYKGDGYTPVRVSTYAVENDVASQTDYSTAVVFAQQMRGHLFVWLFVDHLNWMWCYDVAEDRWHKRSIWDATSCIFRPHFAGSSMSAFGKTLVGDRTSEWIYEMSFDFFEDVLVA